ncbi:TBC1 domain family member 22B, partial [Geodia barretti]
RGFSGALGGGNYLRIARTNFGANEKKFTDHNAFSLTATTQRFRATASMAAIDSKKNTFWKKGGSGTKIPGRPQQVYGASGAAADHMAHSKLFGPPVVMRKSEAGSSEVQAEVGGAGGGATGPLVAGRSRSKTFEEYERDTTDAWDDREEREDMSRLSVPAELENELKQQQLKETCSDSAPAPPRRREGRGKGDIKSFFTDVVLPRTAGSPSLRTKRTGSTGSGKGGGSRSRSGSERNVPSPEQRDSDPMDIFDPPDRETMRLQKFGKLLAGPNTDLDEVRKLSWSGIPPPVRATTWQLLCGYLPANIDRREDTLKRKRLEYKNSIDQYYHMRSDTLHRDTFRQIHIDVPRMNPDVPLFQQQMVQESFERILFIWSMRHPASGYVQGINDLVTPFFVVFLSYYISGDKNPENYNFSQLSPQTLQWIEADSFWCLQHLMEGIQDNYTLAQPGVQAKIIALKDLIQRIDAPLDAHLARNAVEYIQFSFRWMNNLLMREFPLRCVIRLWDSYLVRREGNSLSKSYI